MKKYIPVLTLFFLSVVSISCRRECCTVPEQHNSIYALKNNADWSAPLSLSKVAANGDTIALNATVGEESLYAVLKKVGNSYQVIETRFAFTLGRDMMVSRYELDASQPNVFTASLDQSNILGGTFTFYFKQVDDSVPGTHPSTISFKGGIFKVNW